MTETSAEFRGLSQAMAMIPWDWVESDQRVFRLERHADGWSASLFSYDRGDISVIINGASRPAYAVRGLAALAKEKAQAA